jgi:LmbE family N-acetylglucosaminyl deacetylase
LPLPPKELLRLAAVSVFRLGLRLSSRPYAASPGSLLVVAPHADDETLGCGGLIAAQARTGRRVTVVYLTDSAGSPPGLPAVARQRRAEAEAALSLLGVDVGRTAWLDLPDGTLDRLPAEVRRQAVGQMARLIGEHRPGEVVAPYRAGGSTEHTAACALTREALAAAGGGRLLEYPVWAWWNPFRLRRRLGNRVGNLCLALGSDRALKRRALACHRSQVVATPPARDPALPAVLARACCGSREFFFASQIPARQTPAA